MNTCWRRQHGQGWGCPEQRKQDVQATETWEPVDGTGGQQLWIMGAQRNSEETRQSRIQGLRMAPSGIAFYPKSNGEPLQSFKRGNDMV